MLDDLIVSRVRIKILKLYFLNPDKIFHLREIQRQTNEAMNAIRREMNYLKDCGFMTSEYRGNRKYFTARKDSPLYFDLLALFNKMYGLGGEIIKNKLRLGKVKFVMLSGKFVRGKEKSSSEVDLLVVGRVILPELAQIIKSEEKRKGREINYTIMTEEEFSFRKKRRDPFILSVLYHSRIMIIGDEEELLK